MSKYIYDDIQQKFDIENALTIQKMEWADGNEANEDRIGYFVTGCNGIELASAESYICGVTIQNQTFLSPDENDPKWCVVQSLGVCTVRDNGSLVAGESCMPGNGGIAVKSNNNFGYRVLKRIDDNHIQIMIAPNNDMVQRIKNDVTSVSSSIDTKLNRTTAVNTSNTNYTTSIARGISLTTETPTSITNGCIVGVYE